MLKTKKLITIILTSILVILTLFAGVLIPTKADEPETQEPTTQKISILDTGGVSVLFYYVEPTPLSHLVKVKKLVPEEGITSFDEKLNVSSSWTGEGALATIRLYFNIDLTGTPYENFNNVTIEMSNLTLDGFWLESSDGETFEEIKVSGKKASETAYNLEKGGEYFNSRFFASQGNLSATIQREEGDSRISVYSKVGVFSGYHIEKDAGYWDVEELPHGQLKEVEVSFDLACYVEIDEDKIIKAEEEQPNEGPNEENKFEKVEGTLNEAGDKLSEIINKYTGVAIGGTSSIVVVAVILLIILRRRKRR